MPENPATWCRRMMEEAPDGETSYHYHQLHEMWSKREEEKDGKDLRKL